jgi:AraC-like DNA-binding protein
MGGKFKRTMTPDTFATRSVRTQDQLEAWREWYRPLLEVMPRHSTGDGFAAETELWKLGGWALSRTASALPVHVARTRTNLRRDPVDHWVISYCIRGSHFARTAGADIQVPSKVPFLWSIGQEFLHERTHADRVQFFMPRAAFRDIAPLLDAALGSTLDTPLGHVLGDYMIALERRLPDMTEADLPRLTNAVGAMVAAAVAPSAGRAAVAQRQIHLGRRERVRQVVRRHLRTPTFGPTILCRLVGMSRSNLYRLFEDDGGVTRYIQSQRLHEARAVLTDPASKKSISAIAEDLCFADASSFSRTFRREFGHSPGEVRSAAMAGLTLSAMPRSSVASARADFSELLRGF